MTRSTKFAPREFYHIYNRGTEKRKTFLTKKDYERFIALLYLCNSENKVDIKRQGSTLSKILITEKGSELVDLCAYCLMPNHFHLILKEKNDGGISKFMQKLVTGYTMYFNKLYERNGALFQGKFKAEHANDDNYLSYLIAYVHLNPVKLLDPLWKENGIKKNKNAEKFLETYVYSSYYEYSGRKRVVSKILSLNAFPKYFNTPNDFKSCIKEWINFNDSTRSNLVEN